VSGYGKVNLGNKKQLKLHRPSEEEKNKKFLRRINFKGENKTKHT